MGSIFEDLLYGGKGGLLDIRGLCDIDNPYGDMDTPETLPSLEAFCTHLVEHDPGSTAPITTQELLFYITNPHELNEDRKNRITEILNNNSELMDDFKEIEIEILRCI